MNVSQQQVARWEAPESDIKSSTLLRLSAALGVTVSYLMGIDVVDGSVRFEDERVHELGELFQAMDPQSREALMVVARSLACSSQSPHAEH